MTTEALDPRAAHAASGVPPHEDVVIFLDVYESLGRCIGRQKAMPALGGEKATYFLDLVRCHGLAGHHLIQLADGVEGSWSDAYDYLEAAADWVEMLSRANDPACYPGSKHAEAARAKLERAAKTPPASPPGP